MTLTRIRILRGQGDLRIYVDDVNDAYTLATELSLMMPYTIVTETQSGQLLKTFYMGKEVPIH